jgi:SPP1 family predicted phage head-tail adaptor
MMDKRHLVVIETPANTLNDYGENVQTWSTFVTVFGAIQGIAGREFIIANNKNAEMDYRIFTEFVEDVKPTMRVKFGARIFAIVSVINVDELNRELQLLCKEVVA